MALPFATVGGKITAAFINAIVTAVNLGGHTVVVPASATTAVGSAVVGPNGSVSLSGAGTSVSINGCFTSAYRNYRVIFSWTTASVTGDMTARLRFAGADLAANSSYGWSKQQSYFTGATQTITGSTTAILGSAMNVARLNGGNGGQSTFDIANPMVTANTTITGISTDGNYGSTFQGAALNTNTYDGITFLFSGVITGNLVIEGYNNG